MNKKLKANMLKVFVICFMITMAFAFSQVALAEKADLWGPKNEIGNKIGLGERDPREIAASVINVILGFLGIIAVVIILLAGFKWMTAGGNEDKIGEAKGLLSAGIIGLIIILASWGLATWVLTLLYTKTGAAG